MQFDENRLEQIVAEVKSLFREPRENRPRGRQDYLARHALMVLSVGARPKLPRCAR